jgi:Zn-finger nucleic acid-binding protein
MQKPKLICPVCGAEMNHHAFKIDYSSEDQNEGVSFDGTVKEVHTCPHCEHIELRKA